MYPWFGKGSPDVKAVDVNFGAAPVDWTVGICQAPKISMVMVVVPHILMLMLMLMLIPIKRSTAFVFDPKVGEWENAVASLES